MGVIVAEGNKIIKDMDILDNGSIVTWDILGRKGLLDHKKQRADFNAQRQALRIKLDDIRNGITSLSGGNQQKVVLAKWLTRNPRLLILDNPTQGVDVGAKAEIYQLILQFAREGKTVIINTLEIPEIKKVSDRCVVLYDGAVAKIFSHEEINEQDVMMYSTNAVAAAGKSED
jgi:ribose transport system ATP-binding protein